MPLLLVIGAAYVAYAANVEEAENDPDVDLTTKQRIELLESERTLSFMDLPIATISFFDGDYKDASAFLSNRVQDILESNHWLGGWLMRDKDASGQVKIFFDPSGASRAGSEEHGHFECFEPYVIPLSRDTTRYEDYAKLLGSMGAVVPRNQELIGKNLPFFKVSVVPDADMPDERFALVVSLSHMVGDGKTFYKLFNMLNEEARIDELNAVRRRSFHLALESIFGNLEAHYVRDAVRRPLIDFGGGSLEEDKKVYKMFFISEEWLLKRKGRRGSVFEPDSSPTPLVTSHSSGIVSANSILTSWFFTVNEASVGLLISDMRSRIAGCPIGETDCGNYIHAIAFTPDDYKTPALIQQSLKTMRRCGSDPPVDLPDFGWNTTCSVSTNWSSCDRGDELYFAESVRQQLHLPLHDGHILKTLPDRISVINIFTACPRDLDGGERRAAAFVVCRESVWKKIQAPG